MCATLVTDLLLATHAPGSSRFFVTAIVLGPWQAPRAETFADAAALRCSGSTWHSIVGRRRSRPIGEALLAATNMYRITLEVPSIRFEAGGWPADEISTTVQKKNTCTNDASGAFSGGRHLVRCEGSSSQCHRLTRWISPQISPRSGVNQLGRS